MPTSFPKLLDENPCETSHPPRDYIDSLAVTALVCVALIGAAYVPEWFPGAPRAWQSAGIVGLAACVGLSELKRRRIQHSMHTLSGACTIDPLTGLENERGFARELHRQLSQLRRQGTPLSILAFEIDGFERILELGGKHAGKSAIREVAQIAGNSLREFDVLARVEGIRFTAILPTTRLIDAEAIAERIRVSVEEAPVLDTRLQGALTVSIGIAAAVTLDTEDSVRARVHAALRNAQRLGPNRCCSQAMRLEPFSSSTGESCETEPTQFLM